jgi:hypothetical protein
MDQAVFLREFGETWALVGNRKRTRLKWYRFAQLGLLARIVVSNGIPGHYAEFGTWRGGSLYLVAKQWELLRQQRTLYGFDSFEGLPEPDPVRDGHDLYAGMFDDTSYEEVLAFFREQAMSRVRLVPGWFEETIATVDDVPLALCHIDADCYDGCKLALERTYDNMAPGGFIVLDDYRQPSCSGATIAAEEFFARRQETIQMAPGIDCSGWIQKL